MHYCKGLMVYNIAMPKRQVLTGKQIEKIQLLRLRNFSYNEITIKLSISQHLVRKYCSHIKPIKEELKFSKAIKVGRYDYKFNEPVAQGKMYVDYFKKKI